MKDLNDEGEKMGEGNWNESDLWQRVGQLMEIRDDLRVTAHVLQRRAARLP